MAKGKGNRTFRLADLSPRQKCVGKVYLKDEEGHRLVDEAGQWIWRPCGNWPLRGSTVCRFHGANAAVLKKAEEQLKAARDELMALLLGIARDESQSANDRLKAITWGLERAGFKGGINFDVHAPEPKYIEMLRKLFNSTEDDDDEPEPVEPTSDGPEESTSDAKRSTSNNPHSSPSDYDWVDRHSDELDPDADPTAAPYRGQPAQREQHPYGPPPFGFAQPVYAPRSPSDRR
jgi:hypothetical protein